MVNKYRVTFDSEDGNKFVIYKSDGATVEFKQSIHDLYYHDIRWRRHNTKEFTLVSTVAANKENFTQRQVKNADVAVRLYKSICTPSHNDFISAVTKRLIKKCPISVEHAKNTLEINGPSVASLKSKTVRMAPEVVVTDIVTVVPQQILDLHQAVTLRVDFFILMACAILVVFPANFSIYLRVVLLVAKTILN